MTWSKPNFYGAVALLAVGCVADDRAGAAADAKHYLVYDSSIPLPDVRGGFDLMAVDLNRQQLFVPPKTITPWKSP
jgi:hypothetical protein